MSRRMADDDDDEFSRRDAGRKREADMTNKSKLCGTRAPVASTWRRRRQRGARYRIRVVGAAEALAVERAGLVCGERAQHAMPRVQAASVVVE